LRIEGKEEKKILKKEREREKTHGHQNRKHQQSCINENADIHAQNFEEGLFQSCLDAGSDKNRGCCL
jgi:hypothetical protein